MTPSRRRGSRWFFVDCGGPRSRRPVDAALIVLGVLIAVLSAVGAGDRGLLQQSITRAADALPEWVIQAFTLSYALGGAYVVAVVGAVLVTAPRRGRLPLATLLAVVGSTLAVVLGAWLVDGGWPEVDLWVTSGRDGGFPTVRVAVVTAVLLVLRPWIAVSFRRFNAAVVALECVSALVVGVANPADITGALGLGMAASGAVLVALGSPGGHPDLGQVEAALEDVGIQVRNLRFTDEQPWGVRTLLGDSRDRGTLLVKVYGRDATDAQLAARLWRSLIYTDQQFDTASRLQLVEHEALVTILAERAGTSVSPVIVAAAARQGDAVLVLGAPPHPLGDDEVEPTDDALREMWTAVSRMHAHDVCHGELTLDRMGDEAGRLVLFDFSAGSLGASPEAKAREVATLLTSQALRTGPDRATDAALAVLGAEGVAAAQPYLQRAALPRSVRGAAEVKPTLTGLREAVASRTGVEAPLAQVARIQWRDVIQTGVLLLGAYVLLTLLAQIEWSTVLEAWAEASWGWILLAVVVAQVAFVSDAVSTMSWATARLPLWPTVMLQYAIKLVAMALSSTAGRVGMNTAFLRRFGASPTEAMTGTALDALAEWIVRLSIVAVALIVTEGDPDLQAAPGSADTLQRLVTLLVVGTIATIVTVMSVSRLRRRVVTFLRNGWAASRVVLASPSRGFLLLGSNLASLLIGATAMYCNVQGIHPSLDYGTVVVVTAVSALLTTVLPSPGNVGVGEAAIAGALVAVGVPSGPAFAIAVTQRICTAYLPPVIGMFALRWLRRQEYVA